MQKASAKTGDLTAIKQAIARGEDKNALLTDGKTVYVRIKEYSTKPLDDTTPKGEEAEFTLGDEIELVQKKMGFQSSGLSR